MKTSKDIADENIMTDLKNGDFDSAAILFERYHIRIYNYFYRMTYLRDVSQDLTQNTFHRILKYRQSFNAKKSFKSWLFGIARNEFLAFAEDKKIVLRILMKNFHYLILLKIREKSLKI